MRVAMPWLRQLVASFFIQSADSLVGPSMWGGQGRQIFSKNSYFPFVRTLISLFHVYSSFD